MPNRIANNGLRIKKESVFSDRNLVHNYWVTCDSSRLKLTDTVCLFSCIWQKKKINPRIQEFGIPPALDVWTI